MEDGIVGLGGFFQGMALEQLTNRSGELRQQIMLRGDAVAVLKGSRIGHGWAGGQGVGCVVGNVGHQNRDLLRRMGGTGQPAAFDGRQMLADCVDLRDRRPGAYQRLVGCDQIFQRDLVVDGFFGDGRAAAAEQENHKGRSILGAERFKHGFGGADGFLIGRRMASEKIAEAANLRSWRGGTGDDPFKAVSGLHVQCSHHGMRRLAQCHDEDSVVGMEIVQVFANAQHAALANHMLFESTINAGPGQGVFEKMARSDAHFDGFGF